MTPAPHGDNEPPKHPSARRGPEQWSQADLDALHEILRESGTLAELVESYKNAKWFRRQVKWWGIWVLGLPTVALTFWEPIEKLIKLIKRAIN